jgi:ankyrin repeat protein
VTAACRCCGTHKYGLIIEAKKKRAIGGYAALHFACRYGHTEIAMALITNRANFEL